MSAPEPSTPKTRRTRDSLVAATRAELARHGRFTAERIAARSGTSPATFYHYFPSKEDALVAAFEALMGDLAAFVEQELAIERLLDEGLEARCHGLAAATAGFFAEHALLFRCALAGLPGSRRLRDVYRAGETASFGLFRAFVTRGQRAGAIRSGDVDALARGLLVLTQGLNNPLVVQAKRRDALLAELGRALHAYLAPDATPPDAAR